MLLPSANVMNSIFGESLFDDFFDDFARPMRTASRYNTSTGIMRTDVKESDTGYELDIDLPGCKKENVKAELKMGILPLMQRRTRTTIRKMRVESISAVRDIMVLAAEASMWARKSIRKTSRQNLKMVF